MCVTQYALSIAPSAHPVVPAVEPSTRLESHGRIIHAARSAHVSTYCTDLTPAPPTSASRSACAMLSSARTAASLVFRQRAKDQLPKCAQNNARAAMGLFSNVSKYASDGMLLGAAAVDGPFAPCPASRVCRRAALITAFSAAVRAARFRSLASSRCSGDSTSRRRRLPAVLATLCRSCVPGEYPARIAPT